MVNRRLNPDLFGPQAQEISPDEPSYSAVATRRLEEKTKEVAKQVSHIESLIEVMQSQMTSLIQNTERRTEAFSKALSDLEREFREQGLEQQRIFQQIQGRLREQNLKDSQMEAMIERYNTTLSHFENKISVISTRLSEKDMTLMSYRKIMEKIVDEVERLKSSRFVQSRHPQI